MKTNTRIDSNNQLLLVKQNDLLIQWQAAHIELNKVKERELMLRNQILEQVDCNEEGTTKVAFGGEVLKVSSPIRRKVVGEVPDSLKHVVQYKPSLKLDVYRGLSDWNRKRMDKLMDIKAGQKGLRV